MDLRLVPQASGSRANSYDLQPGLSNDWSWTRSLLGWLPASRDFRRSMYRGERSREKDRAKAPECADDEDGEPSKGTRVREMKGGEGGTSTLMEEELRHRAAPRVEGRPRSGHSNPQHPFRFYIHT
ncbi:hypothetical protein ALC56_08664 [Trachymyrmex septentrionalis]|uniref:Uncharacterized protein n=1 Tax=Trachymyrmex septentrionalis TaxID=34720 RepID=A0A195F8V5_9HYME|nr:hypothetical protein ALC56_08664 [Trachymyrmex septentrionalis]